MKSKKWLKRIGSIGVILAVFVAVFFISFVRVTSVVNGISIDAAGTDFTKPTLSEVKWHVYSSATVMRPFYRNFVYGLGLKGNERVMDFGSGAGGEAIDLAEVLSKHGGRLTCFDISKTWLEVVRRRLAGYNNVEYQLGDITTVNIPSGSYDAIVMHLVLHDIDAEIRPAILRSLARILKPGGRIFFREPFGSDYAMSIDDLKNLMKGASLQEKNVRATNPLLVWPMCQGVYEKE